MSELYLFVLWENARCAEDRIMADIGRHVSVKAVLPQRWPGDAQAGYARFYGAKAALAAGKEKSCGSGEFLTIIVEDGNPRYGWQETSRGTEYVNLRIFLMKQRYRRWANGSHAVHATNSVRETARDIFLLTGRTYSAWQADTSPTNVRILPGDDGWMGWWELRLATEAVGATCEVSNDKIVLTTCNIADCVSVLRAKKVEGDCYAVCVDGRRGEIILRTPKDYDSVASRIERAVPAFARTGCSVDYVTDLRESLRADWKWSRRFWRTWPSLCRRPVCYHLDLNAENYGVFVREDVGGATLEQMLDKGMSSEQAECVANQMIKLAAALFAEGICHREINPATLIVDERGGLRVRDFRFATSLKCTREPKWLEKDWRVLAKLNLSGRPKAWEWNDCYSLSKCIEELPAFKSKAEILSRLNRNTLGSCRKVNFRFNFSLRMFLKGRYCAGHLQMRADSRFDNLVDTLKQSAWAGGVSLDRLCLVGSTPLNVYGIRQCGDVDFLCDGDYAALRLTDHRLVSAESDLDWYAHTKADLIWNPQLHFRYRGVKVITLEELDRFKRRRRKGAKDRRDRLLIKAS